jgi:hypothetical protein
MHPREAALDPHIIGKQLSTRNPTCCRPKPLCLAAASTTSAATKEGSGRDLPRSPRSLLHSQQDGHAQCGGRPWHGSPSIVESGLEGSGVPLPPSQSSPAWGAGMGH